MSAWQAVLLGIVQGATEFLPISSSGHLVMGQELLGVRIPGVAFEVALHVATLLSVIVVYWARLARLIVGALRGERDAWRYLARLAVATVPAGVAGVAGGDLVERVFEDAAVSGVALLVTGAFLWTMRWALPRADRQTLGWWDALLVGLAQGVALVPGISRSGATVVAAVWLRVRPREAAEFSFLLAIPAILGAAVLEFPKLADGGGGVGAVALGAGALAAATTGVAAIRAFVRLLERQTFHRFGVYCWVVGALFLVYLLAR